MNVSPPEATVACAALLAVVVPAILLWPASVTPTAYVESRAVSIPRVAAVEPEAALEQPLFAESRRAVAQRGENEEKVAPDASPEPPTLTGIVRRLRGGGLVLVKGRSGETVQMAPGEQVDGWALLSIAGTSATFRGAAGQKQVELDSGKRARPGRAPSPQVSPE